MATHGFTNSDIIAISSAVIALCALAVAIWQGHLTRHHSVLSARPLVEIMACVGDPQQDGIVLKNCGPGPAIVSKLLVTSDRIRYNLLNEPEYQKLIAAWIQGLPFTPSFGTFHADDNTIIGSGDRVQLLFINPHPNRTTLLKHLESKFDNMEIDIEYKCLYGKTHTSKYRRGVSNAA